VNRSTLILHKQFEGAAGFEFFGDAQAEGAGANSCRDIAGEADHAFAVGGHDLGLDAPGDGVPGLEIGSATSWMGAQ